MFSHFHRFALGMFFTLMYLLSLKDTYIVCMHIQLPQIHNPDAYSKHNEPQDISVGSESSMELA